MPIQATNCSVLSTNSWLTDTGVVLPFFSPLKCWFIYFLKVNEGYVKVKVTAGTITINAKEAAHLLLP